ncbi:unnamed protein product [Moneuplotes crassus]|uniref:Uncharacterized protein n=1 Tax=Euplotes crassus TaxID=5936 RepID=A0AAD1XHQ1_EUPCR|nr:unnamed protein product [Moneuplotes crassus]
MKGGQNNPGQDEFNKAHDFDNPYGIDYSKVNNNEINNPYGTSATSGYPPSTSSTGSYPNHYGDDFRTFETSGQKPDQEKYHNSEMSSNYDAYNDQLNQPNQNFDAMHNQYNPYTPQENSQGLNGEGFNPHSFGYQEPIQNNSYMGTEGPDPSGLNPYSSNLLTKPKDYKPEAKSYKNVQIHERAKGVPVLLSITKNQRKILERQIISLYPDILNPGEAENVKHCTFLSQLSGFGLIFGTPYSLILFQRATQEASGSSLRYRMMNRAFFLQILILGSSYYTYRNAVTTLDKYSQKYLRNLGDEEIMNFEKQDPKIINKKANGE